MTEITDGNYLVHTSSGFVLLDIWSPTCQPCLRMAPILEQIQTEMPSLKVVKMNAMENSSNLQSAKDLGVNGVPAFFVFKDGQIVEKWTGFKAKDSLMSILQKHI